MYGVGGTYVGTCHYQYSAWPEQFIEPVQQFVWMVAMLFCSTFKSLNSLYFAFAFVINCKYFDLFPKVIDMLIPITPLIDLVILLRK